MSKANILRRIAGECLNTVEGIQDHQAGLLPGAGITLIIPVWPDKFRTVCDSLILPSN
jgi:hypothetical protein